MLTPHQLKILDFITTYFDQHHYSPTLTEITQALNKQSRATTHRIVQSLESEGYLTLTSGKRRNIALTNKHLQRTGSLPIVGRIAAGKPIEAIFSQDTLNLSELAGTDRYILRVSGNSMIDEGIFDGDLVICRYAQTASDGDIVVALIDNQNATLKRFYRKNKTQVILKPANAELSPIVYSAQQVAIQGILIGLLRYF